jgi:hypothetical protein
MKGPWQSALDVYVVGDRFVKFRGTWLDRDASAGRAEYEEFVARWAMPLPTGEVAL